MYLDRPFTYRTGWARLAAGILDYIIMVLFSTVVLGLHLFSDSIWVVLTVVTLVALGPPAYTVISHAKFGCTVGKYFLNLRVYNMEGKLPGWSRAAIRDCGPLILAIYLTYHQCGLAISGVSVAQVYDYPTKANPLLGLAAFFWFLLEIMTMLYHRRRRALHDLVAGTQVIRFSRAEEVESP